MKHDPMCPMTTPDGYLCCCNLIARVREDERKQYAAKWYSQQELDAAVAAAREDEANSSDEIIEAIDGLLHEDPCDCAECRVIVMAQKMIANLMDIPARAR